MPPLGQASDELRLIAWLAPEGAAVTEGRPLFEVETDKATLEVEAVASGTLLRTLCRAGETVLAGTIVGWIGEPGEEVPEQAPPARKVPATPAARALARERGVDLATVTGTGPGGRVERHDVLEAAAAHDAPTSGEPVPGHRQAIARRLEAAARVPQFSVARTIDARHALRQAAETEGATLTHVLLRALSTALRASPLVNRIWVEDGPRLRPLEHAHVGLAVAGDDTLIVATVPDPGAATLEELAGTTRRIVEEARAGRLTAAGPAAVTLSNLGMFAIDRFEAIVDSGQTAVLAVGRVVERPSVTDEGIQAVPQLDLTLTADHRAIDGAEAARFLAAVCELLEG